jgi:hypothetical protein
MLDTIIAAYVQKLPAAERRALTQFAAARRSGRRPTFTPSRGPLPLLRELAACDDERERLRVERLRVVRQKRRFR